MDSKSERGRSSTSPSLPFTPIFSPQEELILLEEYTEFIETNGEQVSSKWVKFLETSKLKQKFNRRQIAKKMVGLQKRYEKIKSSSPSLSRPRLQQDDQQQRFLELCESLWGGGEGGKRGVKTDLPLVVAEPCFSSNRWNELQLKEIELYCQKLALQQKDCQLRLRRLRAENNHGGEKSKCQPRACMNHLPSSQDDAELFEVAPVEEEEEETKEEEVQETEEEEEEEVDETEEEKEVDETEREEDETEEEVVETEEEEEEEVVETEEEEDNYIVQYRDLDEKVCEQESYKSTKPEDGKNQEMDLCMDNGISSKQDTVIPGSKIVEDEELENKAVDDLPIVCVEQRTENTQSCDGIEKAVVDGNTSTEAEVVQIDEGGKRKVAEVKTLESAGVIIEEVVAGDHNKSVILDDVVAGEPSVIIDDVVAGDPNKRSLESGEIIGVVENTQSCDLVEKAVVDAGTTTKEVEFVQVDEPSSKNKGRKRKLAEVKTLDSPVIIEHVVAGDPKKKALESGVIIEEVVEGSPNKRRAFKGLKVRVHFTGKVKNSGHIIESSGGEVPLTICLGNEDMIDGFSEGVEGMRIGGKRRIIIPPSMGFGEQGLGKDVPPNSWLEYEVELVGVRKCTDQIL